MHLTQSLNILVIVLNTSYETPYFNVYFYNNFIIELNINYVCYFCVLYPIRSVNSDVEHFHSATDSYESVSHAISLNVTAHGRYSSHKVPDYCGTSSGTNDGKWSGILRSAKVSSDCANSLLRKFTYSRERVKVRF